MSASSSDSVNLETGAGAAVEVETTTTAVANPQQRVAELAALRLRVMPILTALKDEYEKRTARGYPVIVDNVERAGVFGIDLAPGFGLYFMTDGTSLFADLHGTRLRTDALSSANAEKFSGRPETERFDIDSTWEEHRFRDLISRLLSRWNTQQTRLYRVDS
jgi:hypothetical protein